MKKKSRKKKYVAEPWRFRIDELTAIANDTQRIIEKRIGFRVEYDMSVSFMTKIISQEHATVLCGLLNLCMPDANGSWTTFKSGILFGEIFRGHITGTKKNKHRVKLNDVKAIKAASLKMAVAFMDMKG